MGVAFTIDGGDTMHKACFAYILSGLSDGGLWHDGEDDDDDEGALFVPDVITFMHASDARIYGLTTELKEWDDFYSDIYSTMDGVSEILSLEEMQRAGRHAPVAMEVAQEFRQEHTFLPMVLHLIRLPYSAPWVASMYKEIKETWPQLSIVDCFQLACAVRPMAPDDKDEKHLLNYHPILRGYNRDANRPFNAVTDVRLGQNIMKPCPPEHAFRVTEFSVKGGSSDISEARRTKLGKLVAIPREDRWDRWAMDIIYPKLTKEQQMQAQREAARTFGDCVEAATIKKYFGTVVPGYSDVKYSITCGQAIEQLLSILGGKKK